MSAMGKSVSYKQAKLDENWDSIVIGSGIGGLTAAVLLSVHGGKRVLVLERHYTAGGFTHSFSRPGFDWDVGLHYIGQVEDARSPIRRAFDHLTGGTLKWAAMPQEYDRVIAPGRTFEFVAGKDLLSEQLKGSFPGEAQAIDRYLSAVRAANAWSGLYYAEKVLPAPAAALAGAALRAPYMRWARQTTLDVLSGITRNSELIGVLTAQWGDYGLPPGQSSFAIHATIAEHYFAGASYPVGGASAIARAMTPQIERNGGAVVTSAEAAEILVTDGKAVGVRMADGRVLRAAQVISDAGAGNTFNRLLAKEVSEVEQLRAELLKLEPSTSHLSLYVGLDRDDAALGLKGTNLWVYPGLDHDENVRRFAADVSAPFPAVYISFPSAKDPDFARRHPGHSTIEMIVPVGYDAFARWACERWRNRGEEYEELKRGLTERLLDELVRQVPQVKGHVVHAELSTPVTTRHFMNYERGEIYGLAASPARYQLRSLGARTPIKNLYLTGQDVSSLGVVGALYGGAISASAALGRNLMGALNKPLPQ